MIIQKTAVRNREIFVAYQHRESIENLAKRYGLSGVTVLQIIRIEKHKVAVSVDEFYEELRSQKLGPQPSVKL